MIENILSGFEVWTDAQGVKSKGKVKSIDNISQAGLSRLRGLILELAIQGKLTSQIPETENSDSDINELINAKKVLVEEGKIKKEKPLSQIKNDEILFEIPENWSWIKLGEIGITNIGLTYSPNDVSSDGLIVLRSSNIQNGRIDLRDIVRVNKEVNDKVLVENGDLLICARNGSRQLVGKCALIMTLDEPMAFGAFMAIFRCQFNEYIKLFIESPTYRRNLDGVSTTTINQITQNNLKNTVIPIPPFEEQKRIVAKVNELMALCDTLEELQTTNLTTHHFLIKSLLEKLTNAVDADELQGAWGKIAEHFDTLFCTEDSIEQLKQTILQLAIMGRLVKQVPTDQSAIELLRGIKQDVNFTSEINENEQPYALPDGWTWCTLNQIIDLKSGNTINKELEHESGEIPYLKVGDMNLPGNEKIITTSSRYVDKTSGIEKYIIPPYSIIFPKRGGAIATNKKRIVQNEIIVDLNIMAMLIDELIFDYVRIWFETVNLWELNNGTSVPQINNKDLFPLLIPFPPKEEQQRIVSKVKDLMALCDSLSSRILTSQELQNLLSQTVIESVH